MGVIRAVSGLLKPLARIIWREPTSLVVRLDLAGFAERLEKLANGTPSELDEALRLEIDAITDKAANEYCRVLLSNADKTLAEQRKFRRGFESRLEEGWHRALGIFHLVQVLCTQFGAEFNDKRRPDAAARQDFVFEALTRLHGRACLTASEIGALLRTGHATGANARWRTMHELAVVMMFIAQHGHDVARRYLEHQIVEMYRGAVTHQEYCELLGEEPLSKEEIEDLQSRCGELVTKYGRDYKKDYGWATEALGSGKRGFAAIARSIDMGQWAPYVRMASHGVHAGPRGAFFDLGLPADIDAIPASPSHFGLADPGANTLISLLQSTVALLNHGLGPNKDDVGDILEGLVLTIQMKILQALVDEGIAAFIEAHELQEKVPPRLTEPPPIWSAPTFGETES